MGGCLKAILITGAVWGVLGLAFVAYLVVAPQLNPAPQRPPTTTLSARDTNRRLFLEEIRWDDSTRADLFRTTLRKSGERCDSVKSATMTRSGVWAVNCTPGRYYSFRFGEDGNLIEANRLN